MVAKVGVMTIFAYSFLVLTV